MKDYGGKDAKENPCQGAKDFRLSSTEDWSDMATRGVARETRAATTAIALANESLFSMAHSIVPG